MPSPALDDFNAYIAARKTQVDQYNAAKKAQVDQTNASNNVKTQVKLLLDQYTADVKLLLDGFQSKGEAFYARVLKRDEAGKHLRKHITAAKASGSDPELCDLLTAISLNQDAEDDNVTIAYAKAL